MAKYKVSIYVETSFHGPGVRSGVAGFQAEFVTKSGTPIIWPEAIEDRFFSEWDTTETRMTIEALIGAFSMLTKPCEVVVFTACSQARAAISQGWLAKWAANNWKNAGGEDVKHADLWGTLWEMMADHDVRLAEDERNTYKSWMQAELSKRAHNMRTVRTTGELREPEPRPLTFI